MDRKDFRRTQKEKEKTARRPTTTTQKHLSTTFRKGKV